MAATSKEATVNRLATSLIVGGLFIAGLTICGCDRSAAEQIAAVASSPPASDGGPVGIEPKAERVSRITVNHNETFLFGARA